MLVRLDASGTDRGPRSREAPEELRPERSPGRQMTGSHEAAEPDLGPVVLAVNAGSSSLKLAAFACAEPPLRLFTGLVDGGASEPALALWAPGAPAEHVPIPDDRPETLAEQIAGVLEGAGVRLAGVGHRVVHGGPRLLSHQLVTPPLLDELRRARPLDPDHLPREIALIEALARRLPGRPQAACFDTAFFRDLPRVAQLLPIPREHGDAGVRRYGFHGLSYDYLTGELRRLGALRERTVLAHLGSGASMTALRDGRPVDTSMSFTPAGGLVMGTRPGDLDPGVLVYLLRAGPLDADGLDELVSRRCGLLGVSGTSGDVRDLLAHRADDPRADEALGLFCHQARKWIGALAAVLEGLDALVFSGGIGEHAAEVRAEICAGLGFLGVALDAERNRVGGPLISAKGAPAEVRVLPTDEELVIARAVMGLVGMAPAPGAPAGGPDGAARKEEEDGRHALA